MPSLPEEQVEGEPREGADGCLGEPGTARWEQAVHSSRQDPQEEPTAGTEMSLEIWWKSLHDLGILSPTSVMC